MAAGDGAHRLDEVLGVGVLEQEAAGPGAETREDVVVLVEGGEDDDPRQVVRDDPAGCLDAVHDRHLHVHEHDVGSQLAAQPDGLGPVVRLTDHLEVLLDGEDEREAGAHEPVVVDEEHAGGCGHDASSGSGIRTRTR